MISFKEMDFSLFAVFLGIIFSIYKYLDTKNREQNRKEFEQYHQLIEDLVEPKSDQKPLYMDRQAAVVYELKHFKRYYPLSLRTLKNLRKTWSEKITEDSRLIEEIDITIEFLKQKVKDK